MTEPWRSTPEYRLHPEVAAAAAKLCEPCAARHPHRTRSLGTMTVPIGVQGLWVSDLHEVPAPNGFPGIVMVECDAALLWRPVLEP